MGQTILFEAVQHDVPGSLFTFMLQLGCDVAARDRLVSCLMERKGGRGRRRERERERERES